MKKLALLILISLMLSASVAVADTYTPQTGDEDDEDQPTTRTGEEGDYGYVVAMAFDSGPEDDRTTYNVGTVITPPYDDDEQAAVDFMTENEGTGRQLDKRTARYIANNEAQGYTLDGEEFIFRESNTGGFDADYRESTTVRWSPDGTQETTRFVSVCGEGTDDCDEGDDYEYISGTTYSKTVDDEGRITQEITTYYPERDALDEDVAVQFDEDGNPIIDEDGRLSVKEEDEDGDFTQASTINPSSALVVSNTPVLKEGKETGDIETSITLGDPDAIDEDGNVIDQNGDGKITAEDGIYFDYNDEDGVTVNRIDDLVESGELSQEQADQMRVNLVETQGMGFSAFETLTFAQTMGRFMKGYEDFKGINQLTSLIWPEWGEEVQARRAKLEQDFVWLTGIQGIATSGICGSIPDFAPEAGDGNFLVGRGPGGNIISSARIQAYKTPAVSFVNISKQQFQTIFGNVTYINGKRYDINDPAFNTKINDIGRFNLQLYRVQFSVTNNLGLESAFEYATGGPQYPDLNFNIEFRGQRNARWFANDQAISHGKSVTTHREKYSANDYDEVCLTFNPELPSGHLIGTGAGTKTTNELCTDFINEAGAPTTIGNAPPEQVPEDEPEGPEGTAI